MRKQIRLLLMLAVPMLLGLASCTEHDSPVMPDDSQATSERVKELKSQLQNTFLYYPILVDNMMCGALSFNLQEDGVASRMGMVTIPEWETIANSDDFDLKVDSCDISWDVVPNYQGFSSDGLTGDALRITMKDELGQTQDVYYLIGKIDADSLKLVIPSEYGPQDLAMWRFENNEHLYISEFTSAVSLVSAAYLGEMIAYVQENIEYLRGQTDESRMAFLQESGMDKVTDWIYDFDSMDKPSPETAPEPARQTTRAVPPPEREPDYPNWMADIRDDVKLRDMVIPGSHDATTYGISSMMATFGQTQPLNLRQQWDSGARVFDLRVRNDWNQIRLFHNFIPCNMSLQEVASDICSLVTSHPTEGAIVIVKGEGNDASSEFIEKIKKIFEMAYPNLPDAATQFNQIYSSSTLDEPYTISKSSDILRSCSNLAEYHPDMTMGDLRGKILVIFRSDKDRSLTSAGYASGWDDDKTLSRYNGAESAVLRVQDNYGQGGKEDASTYLAKKLRDFNDLWDASEKATDKPTWYVNSASGYVWDLEGVLPNYYSMAQHCYPEFVEKVASHLGRGIILQDFTGEDSGYRKYESVIQAIIVIKHTIGTVVTVFKVGWDKARTFAKEVTNHVVDAAKSKWDKVKREVKKIWNWLFGARAGTRDMLNSASTRASSETYYLHGDELVKVCIYNNYLYGDRIKSEDDRWKDYNYIPLSGSPVTWKSCGYENLFNGKTWESGWEPFNDASDKVNGVWFAEFKSKQPITPSKYYMTTSFNGSYYPDRHPKSWKVYAKANASDSWTTIATVTNDNRLSGDQQRFEYPLSVTGRQWQYFRLEVSENHGGSLMQFAEFEFDKK